MNNKSIHNSQPNNIVKDNFLRSVCSRPKSPNIKKWESYLDRKLTQKEKYLLINASNEIDLNKMIMDLAITDCP